MGCGVTRVAVRCKTPLSTGSTGHLIARLLGTLFSIAFLCSPTPATSLQYKLVPLDQGSAAITFTGPIVPGDFHRFGMFLDSAPKDVNLKAIFIDSGGGNLSEASKLAELLSKIRPLVIIPSGTQCTSACFLLFAAAGQRAVAPDALIGVHSASDNGHEDIDSMAMTTLFAREAARYGVPASIIGKLVQTEPDRVTWLDPTDLAAMHVQIIDTNAPSVGPALSPSPSNEGDQRKNSWIQIYSRALLSEAVSLGNLFKPKFTNIGVFRCDNGWYALVLGPYDANSAVETRDRLVNSGDIPKDSLVTQGANFQQPAWNGDESTGDTSSSSTSSVAVEAAAEFFRSSSRSDREATSFLDRVYPAQLLYYGKRSSKAYVMAEKRAFLDRWPKRAYAVRPGSVSTSCDPRNNLCTVSGIVDWRVSSLERNVISTGSAKFQLTFSMGAELTLLSEWSEVITRHAGP